MLRRNQKGSIFFPSDPNKLINPLLVTPPLIEVSCSLMSLSNKKGRRVSHPFLSNIILLSNGEITLVMHDGIYCLISWVPIGPYSPCGRDVGHWKRGSRIGRAGVILMRVATRGIIWPWFDARQIVEWLF